MSSYEIWNGYMKCYDFLTQVDSYQQNLREVAQAASVNAGERILDAGSGTGNLSILLKTMGARVVSCDFSPTALVAHRNKDSDAELVQASLEEPLPFEDEYFDAICCTSVLFALTEKGCKLTLREFNRVLRPGGRLVITVPAVEARLSRLVHMHVSGLTGRLGAVRGRLRALWDMPALVQVLRYNYKLKTLPDWQGFHHFSEIELLQIVEQAEFGNVDIRRTYGGVFLLLSAHKDCAVPNGSHSLLADV